MYHIITITTQIQTLLDSIQSKYQGVNATDRANFATPSIATIRMWRENPVDPNES